MPLTPLGCMRCAASTPLAPVGPLWLCARCVAPGVAPVCLAFEHAWRGGQAQWVCLTCGATLPGDPPPAVPEPTPVPTVAWDC
jgi:hypothetical protein